MNVLKMSTTVEKRVDTSVFYELAVKCLNIFNVEQTEDIEFVFKNIIFSTSFYPSDVLIKHLNLGDDESATLHTSLANLEEVLGVYSQVLGLKNVTKLKSQENKLFNKLILTETDVLGGHTSRRHKNRKYRSCGLDLQPHFGHVFRTARKQEQIKRSPTDTSHKKLPEVDLHLRSVLPGIGGLHQCNRQILQACLRFPCK